MGAGQKRVLCHVLWGITRVEATRKVIRACSDSGVGYLTLFAFSSENWKRPTDEVSGLMSLFMTACGKRGAKSQAA